MGPHTGASYHLADWLEANGYMIRKRSTQARPSLINASRRAAKNLLPVTIKEKIKSGLGADRVKRLQAAEKDSFYSSIDWARTTCYTEPGRHVININLAGRNDQGIVSREDYDEVCNRIIEDLSTVDRRSRQSRSRTSGASAMNLTPARSLKGRATFTFTGTRRLRSATRRAKCRRASSGGAAITGLTAY